MKAPSTDGPVKDFEDVRPYTLDGDAEEELLTTQCECTFVWANREGHPVGVIMSYVFRNGRFWLTASGRRARMKAIRRDPRVSVVVTSMGTSIGRGRSLTYKGMAVLHDAPDVKAWFYQELSTAVRWGQPEAAASFATYLDSPDRLVIEVVPEQRIGFDAAKMWQDAPSAAPADGAALPRTHEPASVGAESSS